MGQNNSTQPAPPPADALPPRRLPSDPSILEIQPLNLEVINVYSDIDRYESLVRIVDSARGYRLALRERRAGQHFFVASKAFPELFVLLASIEIDGIFEEDEEEEEFAPPIQQICGLIWNSRFFEKHDVVCPDILAAAGWATAESLKARGRLALSWIREVELQDTSKYQGKIIEGPGPLAFGLPEAPKFGAVEFEEIEAGLVVRCWSQDRFRGRIKFLQFSWTFSHQGSCFGVDSSKTIAFTTNAEQTAILSPLQVVIPGMESTGRATESSNFQSSSYDDDAGSSSESSSEEEPTL